MMVSRLSFGRKNSVYCFKACKQMKDFEILGKAGVKTLQYSKGTCKLAGNATAVRL